MPTASEGRRAWGRGPRGDFGGSCPCPPVGWRTRPTEETLRLSAGGAAGGPGKGSGGPGAAAGRSRLAREGAAGRLPRPAQPWPTRLVVPAATSRCHVKEASTGVLPLPAPRERLASPPPPPGASRPPPGPRADEPEAERAGTRT